MNSRLAKAFAAQCPDWRPRVWVKERRCRVYLTYPADRGGRGGGDVGYLDFSGDSVRWETALDREDAQELRAALEAARQTVKE